MKKPAIATINLIVLFLLLALSACTFNVGLKKKAVALPAAGAGQERTPRYRLGEWTIARASMHNHTLYSDGCRTPEDLLELAHRQGMAILAITDHREGKICANGMCANVGGIESAGYQKYFDHLARLEQTAQDQGMVLVKGVEVIPYFFNYGRLPNIVVDGLQEHFVVYGITDPQVFAEMPVRNNFDVVKPEPLPGQTPWEKFVDYMKGQGGLVFAAHVDDGEDIWYGPAHGLVPPPIHNIHELKNLTGFAVLPSGWHAKTGGPGGLWDTALIEYLLGMRDKPLWADADSDYHGPRESLAWATTLFYLREFTSAEVMKCMREGRMVALQGEAFQDTFVKEWWVSDSGNPSAMVMLGEETKVKGAPVVRFALDHPVNGVTIRLIKNGQVLKEENGSELTYRDEELVKTRAPAYYRVEVVGPRAERAPGTDAPTMAESELFVNPIFVRFAD